MPQHDPLAETLSIDLAGWQSNRKPRANDGTMRFGLFWPYSGAQVPSSQLAARNPTFLDIGNHIRLAQAIEQVGVDFALIADGYAPSSEAASTAGFQDPRSHGLLWALPLLMATRHLGIISTLHTNYLHPTHIARFASHMDCLSGGRWGWNIVTGFRKNEAQLFGFDAPPDHDMAYDMAEECLDVVRALWGNEPVDHQGKHFRVRGALAGPKPAEPPLLVCAASSDRGRAFAARNCDYVFVASKAFRDLPNIREEVSRHAQAAQRDIAPGLLVLSDMLIREEPGRAEEEYRQIMSSVDPDAQAEWSQTLAKLGGTLTCELLGTPEEVASRILGLRQEFGLNGLLFRLVLWDAAEVRRLRPVLDLLRDAGAWIPPEDRGNSW